MALSISIRPGRASAPQFEKSIEPSLNPSTICMRGNGLRMPSLRKISSQCARGAASARTDRSSALAKAEAIAFGVTLSAWSSTIRWPAQSSCNSWAAVRPTSSVATMGTAWSSGCR